MSTDLYLLPAASVRKDLELARHFVRRANAHFGKTLDVLTPEQDSKRRQLVSLLLQMCPHYREFILDYQAIADFEKSTVEETRKKYRYIELDGRGKPADAQFIFHDEHIDVHWYSGTASADMDAILYSLSVAGDFVLFDPQLSKVYDLRT